MISTKPKRPVVDNRVAGGLFDGYRPISIRANKRLGGSIVAVCRSCREAVAMCQPSIAAAADAGRAHLLAVDHSPAAVAGGAR